MTNEERARAIADKANECCYRTDGYEEAIYGFALKMLRAAETQGQFDGAAAERENAGLWPQKEREYQKMLAEFEARACGAEEMLRIVRTS